MSIRHSGDRRHRADCRNGTTPTVERNSNLQVPALAGERCTRRHGEVLAGCTDMRRDLHAQDTKRPIWVHIASANLAKLTRVRATTGLPPELITYCLLKEHGPRVVPCGDWIYCAWLVPDGRIARASCGCMFSFLVEELKVCAGPDAVVTIGEAASSARGAAAGLRRDRDTLVRGGPGSIAVAAAERVGETYLTVLGWLRSELQATPKQIRRDRGRQLLLRSARDHREALEVLIGQGRRWLDEPGVTRLRVLALALEEATTSASDEGGCAARSSRAHGSSALRQSPVIPDARVRL